MLDGVTNAPGAVDGNAVQVALQLADVVAISTYAFAVSAIILFAMKYIPGLSIRAPEDVEIIGIDSHEFHDEEVGDWEMAEKHNHITQDITTSLRHAGSVGKSA